MPAIQFGPRVVVSVTATGGGDWQVVSTPTGFQGITSALFAENDYIPGFVVFENGTDWEAYDGDATGNFLQISSLTGTVTLTRPSDANIYQSTNSNDRVNAGSGTHTLTLAPSADTWARIWRHINPSWNTFTSGDATPSVAGYALHKTNGTTTITAFDDVETGQEFIVYRNGSDITIQNGASLVLPGGADLTLTADEPCAIFKEDGGVIRWIGGGLSLKSIQTVPNTYASTTLTLSTGAITPTLASHVIAAESGTADDLDTITTTNFNTGDTIKLVADTGDTITVKNGTGNITTDTGADIVLDSTSKFLTVHVTASGVVASLVGDGKIKTYATVTTLRAASTAALEDNQLAYVVDANRGGFFRWDSSDLSTELGYETTNYWGVYYPPNDGVAATDGTEGCWVRTTYLEQGLLYPEWFGAVGDGSTDDSSAIQAAIDFSFALSNTNYQLSAPPPILLQSSNYHLDSGLVVDEDHHGFTLKGTGKGSILSINSNLVALQLGSDYRATGWPSTDASDTTPPDSSASNFFYGAHIEGIEFYSSDGSLTSTCAILNTFTNDFRIRDCRFVDMALGIDNHRINRGYIENNRFIGTGRTADAVAMIRFQGLYDSSVAYTPGGGMHLTDNEFQGAADETKHPAMILVHSIDGLYLTQNHFTFYLNAIHVSPTGEDHNNTITDIFVDSCYFDNVADGGRDVRCDGTVNSSSIYQDIFFSDTLFRGANQGDYGFSIGVTDDGSDSFVSAGKEIKNITFKGCRFRQHDIVSIRCNGPTNSQIAVENVLIDGCFFEDNRINASGSYSDINVNAKSVIISNCMFNASNQTPVGCILIDTNGVPSTAASVVIAGNNFARATYSGVFPWSVDYEAGASVDISGNILKQTETDQEAGGLGWREDNMVVGYCDADSSVVLWEHELTGNNVLMEVSATVTGVYNGGGSQNDYVYRKLRAVLRRNYAGSISFLAGTIDDGQVDISFSSHTKNDEPALFALMTGSAWATSTALSEGEVVVNGGRAYLTVVAGTTDASTGPTHSSKEIAVNGTAALLHLGTEDTNKIILVCSPDQVDGGDASEPMKWSAHVEMTKSN